MVDYTAKVFIIDAKAAEYVMKMKFKLAKNFDDATHVAVVVQGKPIILEKLRYMFINKMIDF